MVENSDVVVVGVEKQADFANESDKRDRSQRIVNVAHTLNETSGRRLIELVDESLASIPDGPRALANGNYGLISLHSCGDLTPLMLKIFKEDGQKLKFLAAFSCCYHKMAPVDDEHEQSAKKSGHRHFGNFPMSSTLKEICNQESFRGFYLGTFGMRLACQQTTFELLPILFWQIGVNSFILTLFLRSIWTGKSAEDHDEHTKQVAYRAILEDYCQKSSP